MNPPRQLTVAAAVFVALALGPATAGADPIIPNGDFGLGYSGFASNYSYRSSGSLPNYGLLRPEGTFAVGTSPGLFHDLWANFGDHTTGQGNMLLVNGNRTPDVIVWTATVDVTPDTQYDFSAWIASVHPRSPASLAFSINGILLDAPFGASATTGLWQQFGAGWYSGTSATAVLSLVNQNTAWNGNDFALDDISLDAIAPPELFRLDTLDTPDGTPNPLDTPEELTPAGPAEAVVPEPASLILFGSGLIALAGRGKRRLK